MMLYEEKVEPTNDTKLNDVTTMFKSKEIGLWHRRLGHISEESLKKTISIKGNLPSCSECLLSSFSRKPFQSVVVREKEILERVYSDIRGPFSSKTAGGASYFVVFIEATPRLLRLMY